MKIKAGDILTAVVTAVTAGTMAFCARDISEGAAEACRVCLEVLIPSLFLFTAAARLMISSGAYLAAGRPFRWISENIFRIRGELFPVLMLSQAAGYPVGAALLSSMEKEGRITEKESEELLCFCISPGPAFITAAAGDMWLPVFAAVSGANIIAALATAPFRKVPLGSADNGKVRLSAEGFVGAISDSAAAMTMICAVVVFAASVMSVLERFGIMDMLSGTAAAAAGCEPDAAMPFVRAFFEISGVTSASLRSAGMYCVLCGELSFGGLCVLLQIKAIMGKLSIKKALAARIPLAALSALIFRLVAGNASCDIILGRAVTAAAVISSGLERIRPTAKLCGTPMLSLFLLLMAVRLIMEKRVEKGIGK